MDISQIEGIKTNKNGKKYVSNPHLLAEVIKSKELGQLTPEAVEMFRVMIENIMTVKKYNDIENKKDCMQQAFLDILMYYKSFDETKFSNAFAYFTSVISNGIAKGWNKCAGKIKTSDVISLDNNVHSL